MRLWQAGIYAVEGISDTLALSPDRCDSSGSFGAMADFQPIVAGTFEKDRIVARPFVIARAFDIPRGQPDLARTVCQKAIRHSLATCLDDSVTPKNSVAPSTPPASNWSQCSIRTSYVNPSAGRSVS